MSSVRLTKNCGGCVGLCPGIQSTFIVLFYISAGVSDEFFFFLLLTSVVFCSPNATHGKPQIAIGVFFLLFGRSSSALCRFDKSLFGKRANICDGTGALGFPFTRLSMSHAAKVVRLSVSSNKRKTK